MIGSIQGGSGAIRHPSPQRIFKKLDADGSGSLDQSELAGLAKRKGTDAASLLGSLDTDKDGKVSADEMSAGMAKQGQGSDASQSAGSQFTTTLMNLLKQLQDSQDGDGTQTQGAQGHGHHHGSGDMFKKLDANGDGTLDETELGGIASRTGQDASKILTDLDTDGDGKVNADELKAGVAKRRQEREAQGQNNGQGQPDQNPVVEMTTALMNILKQLQGSQNGEDATPGTASTSAVPASDQTAALALG